MSQPPLMDPSQPSHIHRVTCDAEWHGRIEYPGLTEWQACPACERRESDDSLEEKLGDREEELMSANETIDELKEDLKSARAGCESFDELQAERDTLKGRCAELEQRLADALR